MKTPSKSRPARALLVTAAVLALARAGTGLAASSIDDELLREVHEFALSNGQSKVIADHKSPQHMEVCVTQSKDAVPVNVNYDGSTRMVKAGECSQFTAKKIKLSPGAKIAAGEELLGKYKHVKAS